jgi:hypothetical protein
MEKISINPVPNLNSPPRKSLPQMRNQKCLQVKRRKATTQKYVIRFALYLGRSVRSVQGFQELHLFALSDVRGNVSIEGETNRRYKLPI